MKYFLMLFLIFFCFVTIAGTNEYSTIPNDLEYKIKDAINENRLNPVQYFSKDNIEIQLKNDNYQYTIVQKNGYYEYEIDVQNTKNKYTKLQRLYNERDLLVHRLDKCEIIKSDREEAEKLIRIPTVAYLFSTIDENSLTNAELRMNKYCNKKI